MKKTIVLLLVAVIALSACLCGCSKNAKGFPVPVSDSKRSALELCKTPRKDSDLEKIYNYVKEGHTTEELNKKYAIECLRQVDDGYVVEYTGNDKLLVLNFDSDAKWVEKDKLLCMYRMSSTRGTFDKLKVGDSVTAVQKADPTAFFPFLVSDYSDILETRHYTEDGYLTKITYDADRKISAITNEIM